MTLDMNRPAATEPQTGTRTKLLQEAADQGYWLSRRQLDNGERAWTWLQHGDSSPQPMFLTRRQALDYMTSKLGETARS